MRSTDDRPLQDSLADSNENPRRSAVERIVMRVREVLDLAPIPEGQLYESLALCIIDAVYSISSRYESTERTVSDFCAWRKWDTELLGQREYRIADFLRDLAPFENRWDRLAEEVFHNRQRTSSRSGICKAEAVYRFARALADSGIDTITD